MLACGTTSGTINIFQIPKIHPECIPENLKPKKQQVERYLVSDVHKSSISSLEWSKNGMKLFSGDSNGIVVLTELDFYMHICKSIEILNESYEVVQLSYYHQNLLISTTYRSIICQKLDKWKITQVGKKGRKLFGNYGAIIYSDNTKPNNSHIYCSRPGLRIWIADMQGNVQKTILFKDVLKKKDVYVTSMTSSTSSLCEDDLAFGTLLTFQDILLVTYNDKTIYVLDPQKMGVVRKFNTTQRILDVATNRDEIFILEESGNLIRLGYNPELINNESIFGLPVNVFPTTMNILGLTLDGCTITPGISELDGNEPSKINTEEAVECTGEENYFDESDLPIKQKRVESISNMYSKISQEDYDDNIIYKHHRYSKSYTKNENGYYKHYQEGTSKTINLSESCTPILPDLRSPESIKNDIETKEKLISDILNFDKIKINMKKADEKKLIDKEFSTKIIPNKILEVKNYESNKIEIDQSNDVKCDNKCLDVSESLTNSNVDEKVELCIQGDNKTIPNIPDLLSIPTEWNLSCVELAEKKRTITESDNSLNDWEII
ncbi:WD repeat-containing protein CG11141 isoform X2 [Onthophagus taurus]